MATRNPTWVHDELALALDVYFRIGVQSARHPDVVELSQILNALPIHTVRPDAQKFRNPNGVNLKLANFAAVDPGYSGAGMAAHGAADLAVFEHYVKRRDELRVVVARLRAWASDGSAPLVPEPDEDEVEVPQGRLSYRLHRQRERSHALVDRKKRQVLALGRCLACEVCGFDFAVTYGSRGEGYIECHHTKPLADSGSTTTRLVDLTLVCSNCHRMIHRCRPWPSVHELRASVEALTRSPSL